LKGRPNETSICRGRIAIGSAAAAYILVVRPWQLQWGATDEERDATLVGDDLIANPDLTTTRAITVGTPVDQVWPWIAQLGQGRSGAASTPTTRSRTGRRRHPQHRPDRPPEWEDIKVEDQVNLHPGGWAGRNRCGAGPSARPARWRVDGRSAAPVRLHLGLCPAGAAGRDDTATGARAIRINPAVGSVPRRARYGGQLRDDATDAPWDQRSVRTDQPLGRQGETLQASVEDPARPTPRSKTTLRRSSGVAALPAWGRLRRV
jgi:hypothetical protein